MSQAGIGPSAFSPSSSFSASSLTAGPQLGPGPTLYPGVEPCTADNPMGMGDPSHGATMSASPPPDSPPPASDAKTKCETCNGKDKDKKPRKLGTYASVSRSFGVYSASTTTWTDMSGNQFQTATSGWGASMPGYGMSEGNVYAWDSAPADTSIKDVALGPSWSGGFLDNTSMNGSGYTLETVGTPSMGLERTNTVPIP